MHSPSAPVYTVWAVKVGVASHSTAMIMFDRVSVPFTVDISDGRQSIQYHQKYQQKLGLWSCGEKLTTCHLIGIKSGLQ